MTTSQHAKYRLVLFSDKAYHLMSLSPFAFAVQRLFLYLLLVIINSLHPHNKLYIAGLFDAWPIDLFETFAGTVTLFCTIAWVLMSSDLLLFDRERFRQNRPYLVLFLAGYLAISFIVVIWPQEWLFD